MTILPVKGILIASVVSLLRLAWQAMRQLHPEAIAAIQSKALFTQFEEVLLAQIGSVSQVLVKEQLNGHSKH